MTTNAVPGWQTSNNVLNMRASAIKWDGETTRPGEAWESYDSIEKAFRSYAMNHLAHWRRGCKTTYQLIACWAPPKENLTDQYARRVAGRLSTALGTPIDPYKTPLDLTRPDVMRELIAAQIPEETGWDAWRATAKFIAAGVKLAFSAAGLSI